MRKTLTAFAALTTVAAQQTPFKLEPTPDPFSWTACGTLASRPLDCGRFEVPLDYGKPELGNASLFVKRMRADPGVRKGTMFHNPGGPGVGAENAQFAYLFEGAGGIYDVVSWDLRGLNSSTPSVRCFKDDDVWHTFWSESLWYQGLETNSNLHSESDIDAFYSHMGAEDAISRAFFEHCQSGSGEMLKYVGSAASARDVAMMADALDGPGSEINYWGESYGSVLGQYIIALFPERLGHVIVGANVYGPIWGEYAPVNMYTSLVTPDTDANLVGFTQLCADSGSSGCSLASSSSTSDSILADIQQLLLDLYDPDRNLPDYLSSSGSLRYEIFIMMQVPSTWPRLATYLSTTMDLVRGWKAGLVPNTALVQAAAEERVQMFERHELKRWVSPDFFPTYWSIMCSDTTDTSDTQIHDVFDQVLETRTPAHSRFLGATWPTEGGWPCHNWETRAVERVSDFRVTPKHPLLLLSNLHDPITSIENSWKMMDNLYPDGSAALGVRAGYGHGSKSMRSTCIINITQAYMRDWTLPPESMIPCPYDESPFVITTPPEAPPSTINWTDCGIVNSYALECSRFSVPFDWADPPSTLTPQNSFSLSLTRLRAPLEKRVGTLFTNQGGPGVPTTGDFGRARAAEMMEQLDEQFDIVSWDQRGLNDTAPSIKCFETAEGWFGLWDGSLWATGIETNSSLRSDIDLENFYSHVDEEDARVRALWEKCNASSGAILPYMGTAANARDIAALADAIEGPDSEINYWGFSYGSILGQFLTVLFPERLGRIILDGVVYGPIGTVEPPEQLFQNLIDYTDRSYHGMAGLCARAGPEGCALSYPGATADSIVADLDQLLLDLYDPEHNRTSKLAPSAVARAILFVVTYNPRRAWQAGASCFQLMKETVAEQKARDGRVDASAVVDLLASCELLGADTAWIDTKLFRDPLYYETHFAVMCADARDPGESTTTSAFDAIVEGRYTSKYFGPMWPVEGAWPCHRWRTRAVERVTDFHVENPKHPILLLSNEFDPITSISNSRRVIEHSFKPGDVGLGIRANYGHCSYSMKSPCIVDVIRAYAKDWTLPPVNMTPCPTEENMFPVT